MKALSVDPACREARDLSVERTPEDEARVAAHRAGCAACAAYQRALEGVVAGVEAAEGQGLDDLARARIRANVRAELEAPAPSRRWVWVGVAAAAAIVLAVVWPGSPAPRWRFVPYAVEGLAAAPVAGEGLSAPAGIQLRAQMEGPVAPAPRFTLIGPGRLVPWPDGPAAVELALEGGLLLADVPPGFPGGVGIRCRSLRISVLGTAFSVDARTEPPSVYVARGRVQVEGPDGTVVLGPGDRFPVTGSEPGPAGGASIEPGAGVGGQTGAVSGDRGAAQGAGVAGVGEAEGGALPGPAAGSGPVDEGDAPAAAPRPRSAQDLELHVRRAPPDGPVGWMQLESDPPGARVVVDGVDLGATPLAVARRPGPVEVHLEHPERAPLAVGLEIREGAPVHLRPVLSPRVREAPTELAVAPAPTVEPVRAAPEPARRGGRTPPRTGPPVVRTPAPEPGGPKTGAAEEGARGPAARTAPAGRQEPTHGPDAVQTGPAPDTAEARYQAAEEHLAAGRTDAARAELEAVVRAFPRDPLADAALFELARLDRDAGRLGQAVQHLDELLARDPEPALLPGARFLRCRCLVELDDARAQPCLTELVEQGTAAGREQDALTLLIEVVLRKQGCESARPWMDRYLQRFPDGGSAAAVRARRARCDVLR